MKFEAGICPKCKGYLLLKSNVPFLVCPLCGQSISEEEAQKLLEARCADKDHVNDVIADCITLEMQYGPELPYMMLGKIADNFPYMESPAYILTKMSGYEFGTVRLYLESFAKIKSQPINVPWAEEFLDHCLNYRNMEFADLFSAYIANKIRKEKQEEYREKLATLRKEYTFKASNPLSTKLLLALYMVSAVINVLLFPGFMFLSGWLCQFVHMYYAINFAIAILFIAVEMGLLYIHHKVFGNRLGMSDFERLWMIIFMSSIVFVLGAAVMGSIWKISL